MWGNPKRNSNTTTEQNPTVNETQNYMEERIDLNGFGKQYYDQLP